MTVAFDAASRSTTGFDNNSVSWTHTPVGTPRGVTVICAIEGASDQISTVSYGGVAMTRVTLAHRTTAEAGGVFGYFLGTGILTGARTVAVVTNPSSGANDWAGWCLTWTAAADTEEVHNQAVVASSANPSLSITPTAQAGIHYGLWHGVGTGVTTAQAGSTHIYINDFGVDVSQTSRKEVASAGATTMGYTLTADVHAHLAIAVQEIAGGGPAPTPQLALAPRIGA